MSETTVLQRLLKYTHRAVFDTSPDADLALRVRGDSGLVWEVADEVLTITTPGDTWDYPLAGKTIGDLAVQLRADGHDVVFQNIGVSGRGAVTLVPGKGDQGQSNGDHIYSFKSLLWMLFSGYGRELDYAQAQVLQALRQMVMHQAEGHWLDVWGAIYGVARLPGETDTQMQERLPDEVFRVRVNGLGIEKAIEDLTGKRVEIREPWKRMFRSSVSKLSGGHHLHDADFWTYHIIQPVAREPVDWERVLSIVNRNRAAGVLVHQPVIEFSPRHIVVQPPVEYAIRNFREDLRSVVCGPTREIPLGVMRLDNNQFSLNHPMMAFQLRTFGNAEGLQTAQDFGGRRNIAWASIALSDGPTLGDMNAILSRGQMRLSQEPKSALSEDFAPSDAVAHRDVRRVERIMSDARGAHLEWGFAVEGIVSRGDVHTMGASAYDGHNDWAGPWSGRTWYGWREVGLTITSTPA